MNTLTLNKVLLNARPLNMKRRLVKDKDFYYKVLDREFNFSITAGGKRIKSSTATISMLKGNSVVWNQQLGIATSWGIQFDSQFMTKSQEGETYVISFDDFTPVQGADNYAFLLYQGSYADFIAGHKYLFLADVIGNYITKITTSIYDGSSYIIPTAGTDKNVARFFTSPSNFTSTITRIGVFVGSENYGKANTIKVAPRIIDLTQMFQAGNEPTTIEEYEARKPIVANENAYNEGEVIHMTAEGIKSVGDNAWDEEYILVGTHLESANAIPVLPNAVYYFNGNFNNGVFWYDNSMQLIKTEFAQNTNKTSPSNAAYMRFALSSNYGTTYNNDIMITLVHSGWKQDTDAGYQPYWEDRLMFDQRIKDEFPDGMKEWDMVYNKNGKGYIVKGTIGIKMTDFSIRKSQDGVFIVSGLQEPPAVDSNGYSIDVIAASYSPSLSAYGNLTDTDTICIAESKLWLSGSSLTQYSTAEEFSASLGDTMVWYKSAEPTIIEYDEPFNLDYRVADFGTEQAIAETNSAPISAEIGYHILKNNLELTLNS